MIIRYIQPILYLLIHFVASTQNHKQIITLQVPGKDQYAVIKEKGASVLPSGRFVTPAGQIIRITHDPFGMALSPNGKKAVTLHNGVFTVIDLATLSHTRVPSYDKKITSPLSNGSFLGVAFSPDSKTVLLRGGDNGAVIMYDIENFQRIDSISLNGRIDGIDYKESFTSDLLLNESNNELLVLDRGNFRLVRINLDSKTNSLLAVFILAGEALHVVSSVLHMGMRDCNKISDPRKYGGDWRRRDWGCFGGGWGLN